ncbi:hypothetical protein F8280_15335 [Micromonospora noduli]|nr:hypothetical protein F8280_15335 [Micromonospora noduli]
MPGAGDDPLGFTEVGLSHGPGCPDFNEPESITLGPGRRRHPRRPYRPGHPERGHHRPDP